jgi:hypothetical protein
VYPVSDAFLDQLQQPARKWKTKIEVTYANEIVTTLDVIVQGYIGLDFQAVRRELHITIVDVNGTLTPGLATDLLAPKGTEMRVYRGLYIPDLADYEYVPMGVYGIVSPATRANEAGHKVEIKGFDRLDALRARQFEAAFTIPAGTDASAGVAMIVAAQMPDVQLRVTTSGYALPETVIAQLASPYDAIKDISAAANLIFYFDPLGTAVAEPFTEQATGITYTVGPTGLLMESNQTWDNTNVASGVIVKGANPDKTTFSVTKWDVDPTSPTYSLGPFGRRPYGYYSELLTTVPQAQAVCDRLYATQVRMPHLAEIYTRGGPQHDIGDLITVVDPRTKLNGDYVIKSGTMPLASTQGDHMRFSLQQSGLGGYIGGR